MTENMRIAPEIMEAVKQLQQRGETLTLEVGRLEFRKAKLLEEIGMLNDKATSLLRAEGKALGIPDGSVWRVTPDGDILIQEPNG